MDILFRRSQCRGDEESKGRNSFLNLSMEMGLSEVFFPHGNFQGKNILAYRSRLFENELQETTIQKTYFLLNIIILCA